MKVCVQLLSLREKNDLFSVFLIVKQDALKCGKKTINKT